MRENTVYERNHHLKTAFSWCGEEICLIMSFKFNVFYGLYVSLYFLTCKVKEILPEFEYR